MASASSDSLKPMKLTKPFWMNFGECQTMPGAVDWQWATALKQQKVHEDAKATEQLEASKQVNSFGFNEAWNSFNVHSFPDGKLEHYWHLTPDKHRDCSQYAALMASDDAKDNKIYVTKGSYFEPRQEWEGSVTLAKRTEIPRAELPVTGSVETLNSRSSPSKTSVSWRTARSEELAALVAQKSVECLVNCDLPPPSSASSASSASASSSIETTSAVGSTKASAMTASSPTLGNEQQPCNSSGSWFGAELLGEALCRSQTRAREAEKVALQACQEKEQLMHLFFREASVSFAYRQWLVSLQAENLCLRMCQGRRAQGAYDDRPPPYSSKRFHAQLKTQQHHSDGRKRRMRQSKGRRKRSELVMCCTLAFALGLSLAGAGLMLGWGMGWIFLPL